MPYREAIVTDNSSLPITLSFTFTGKSTPRLLSSLLFHTFGALGTEFNLVGNDWRNGIVHFTLDGVQFPPYDLSSTGNISGARCGFPWWTQTGLAPIEHTFVFSLVGPSPSVMTDSGSTQPGAGLYYGLQFFYFTYARHALQLQYP